MSSKENEHEAVVVAVAGGKGGIGKTIISSNLTVHLAKRGLRTVAIDLDLGASNLHTFFGIRNPKIEIMDFLDGDSSLEELAVPTKVKNVSIICGSTNVAGAANLPYQRKVKIIRSLQKLPFDYVIVDLGAGSSFNVTDFFLVGKIGIVVIVPQITSLLDAYTFLKSALFRRIQFEWRSHPEISRLIQAYSNPKNTLGIITVEQLAKAIEEVDPMEGQKMRMLLRTFEVKILINQVRHTQDIQIGKTIQQLAAKNLNLAIGNLGHLPYDDAVTRSVNLMTPFAETSPTCPASRQMENICDKIINLALSL